MVSITLIGKAEALKMAQALKMTEFYDRFESHVCTTSAGDFKVIQSAALNNQHKGQEMAVLFLHGYPQTHAIFHKLAPLLQDKVTMVMADLRGYGDAPKPPSDATHSAYSKRAMAQDMAEIMAHLGHETFAVVGHDRGGRVAHRLACDYRDRVTHLSVLDIAPTLSMYEGTDMAFATAYYHWFFLIQKAPLPETLIGADPEFYLRTKFAQWSASDNWLDERLFQHYLSAFKNPKVIHASCEDYRAAATIDLIHDRKDSADKLQMPVQALWGDGGFVGRSYDVIAEWEKRAVNVIGQAVKGGHFVPEEAPDETAKALLSFWRL